MFANLPRFQEERQMTQNTLAKIALGVMCFSLPSRTAADLTSPTSRKTCPDFKLSDAKGAAVKLSDLKGKVVLLDFWATYCDICKVEIPWYVEFQNKYKQGGLSVVGLSVDEDGWKAVKPFLTEQKVTYTVVLGDWDLAARFGVTAQGGLPVTFLIDRSGKIADSHVGMVDKDGLEKNIQKLLGQR